MKRIANIFDKLISKENLREAHFEVKRGKRVKKRHKANMYEKNLEANLDALHEALANETWNMHEYVCMIRIERGKKRVIYYSKCHEDSIVQHAILRTLGKLIEKKLIRDTYASIKKRGTSKGVRRIKEYINKHKDDPTIYVFKSDIYHYYQSIDHDALKRVVRRMIKEEKAIRLLDRIIDSHPQGIPIGNGLSPMFANMLLSEIDHMAKEKFGIKAYHRYLDDIVAIETGDDSKEALKEFMRELVKRLEGKKLKLKKNVQVFPIERYGIDFLGYVFRRKRVKLRKKTERRFRRASYRYMDFPNDLNRQRLSSYWGMLKPLTKTKRFWNSFFLQPIHELEVCI